MPPLAGIRRRSFDIYLLWLPFVSPAARIAGLFVELSSVRDLLLFAKHLLVATTVEIASAVEDAWSPGLVRE